MAHYLLHSRPIMNVCGPETPILCLQVNEIYHDESLGAHINIALVRLIMVGYRQVNTSR